MQYIHRAKDRIMDVYKVCAMSRGNGKGVTDAVSVSLCVQYFAEPAYDELLPDWLPEYQPPYTLCVEYDKVLIKQEWTPATGWRVKVRKGAREFLNYLCQHYEVVVFTHSTFMVWVPPPSR